jgi:cell wall-associated NlpC family hydrolase
MPHTTPARSLALRQPVHPTVRLLAITAALAGVLVTLMAAPSAHAATRRHHAVRHHAVRHHAARHHRPALGPAAGRVAHAMGIAASERGKPYVYGASGPRAFDCSGLTSYAFHHAGFRAMPRTAAAQSHFARHIARTNMRRGDLIFFNGGGHVYHVGLYAGFSHGHRMVLHAPYPGQRVHTQPLWTNAWFPGTLRFR